MRTGILYFKVMLIMWSSNAECNGDYVTQSPPSMTRKAANGEAAVTMIQEPSSITRSKGKTVRLSCEVNGVDISSAYIHWYRHKKGEALKRILYKAAGSTAYDDETLRNRFVVERVGKTDTLTITKTLEEDSATYYCAYWDTHRDAKPSVTCTKTPRLFSTLIPLQVNKTATEDLHAMIPGNSSVQDVCYCTIQSTPPRQ
ncbi:UNVERIFIED_CONTAM: hypothetical protein FKN15_056068 [Acipenser sinensis]